VDFDELRTTCRVRRKLALTPRAGSRALLRMRREGGFQQRWTLGRAGSFELDADVVEIHAADRTHEGTIHLPGRLWDPDGTTMVGIDVEVHASGRDAIDVAVAPSQVLPDWFRADDLARWTELAHATLDEICEELLWHARADAREQAEQPRAS
jgi:hypothetical protein